LAIALGAAAGWQPRVRACHRADCWLNGQNDRRSSRRMPRTPES